MEHNANAFDSQQHFPIWDAAPAQRFLTHILSCIFYARGAFLEDCFRCVSEQQWRDPKTTHESLLNGGEPLSFSRSPDIDPLSQNGPFVYLRRSLDFPLRRISQRSSTSGIFTALEQQRLGKIQICFSRSKSQDPKALIEFYGLKFRYLKDGSLYVYIKWGGAPYTATPTSCKNPLNEFLRTRPPITGTYYTHPFLYSIDGKPLDSKANPGLGKFIRDAELLLQQRRNVGGGRIGILMYHSQDGVPRDDREKGLAEEKRRLHEVALAEQRKALSLETMCFDTDTLHDQVSVVEPDGLPEKKQNVDQSAHVFDYFASELPSKERTRHGKLGGNWRVRMENMLPLREEASNNLPPTQILSSQQPAIQKLPSRQSPRQQSKRPRESSPNPLHSDSFHYPSRSQSNSKRHRGIRSQIVSHT